MRLTKRAELYESNQGKNGRSERIRTSDPLLPKQVRYQTALRSDRGGRITGFARGLQETKMGKAARGVWVREEGV